VGKTRRSINRPINRLFPIEFHADSKGDCVSNTVENVSGRIESVERKNRREAAKLADLRLKYAS